MSAVESETRKAVDDLVARLEGAPVAVCGDGAVESDEQCDFGTLQGASCATLGLFGSGLACTPGSCTFDTSSCATTRYQDTGPTIIDHETGLEWEKKSAADGIANPADPHDADNLYTWSASFGGNAGSGTAFTAFLHGSPNGLDYHRGRFFDVEHPACFLDHCDWRLPTIAEFRTIARPGPRPCSLDPIFGPNGNSYWTATTPDFNDVSAWMVDFVFDCGGGGNDDKGASHNVRAVRSLCR